MTLEAKTFYKSLINVVGPIAIQNLIAAAALHDVVEDAGVTIEEIEEKFGKIPMLLRPV